MSRQRRLTLLFAVVFVLSAHLCAKQLAVVTDSANPTVELSSSELIKICNGHTREWPDGKPITVVLRDPSAREMQIVLRKVFNMTAAQARGFFQTHRGAIVVADSDDAVVHFVSVNRGAIGIVDLYSLTKDVKVLKIDGKLPVEQGYLLKGNEP